MKAAREEVKRKRERETERERERKKERGVWKGVIMWLFLLPLSSYKHVTCDLQSESLRIQLALTFNLLGSFFSIVIVVVDLFCLLFF